MSEEQKQAWMWIFLAGTAGSLVRAIISPTNWVKDLISVVGGGLITAFVAPGIIERIPGVTQSLSMLIAFLVGLLGMSGCKIAVKWFIGRFPAFLDGFADTQIKRIAPATEPDKEEEKESDSEGE